MSIECWMQYHQLCEPLSIQDCGHQWHMHGRVIWGNKIVDNGFILISSSFAFRLRERRWAGWARYLAWPACQGYHLLRRFDCGLKFPETSFSY